MVQSIHIWKIVFTSWTNIDAATSHNYNQKNLRFSAGSNSAIKLYLEDRIYEQNACKRHHNLELQAAPSL